MAEAIAKREARRRRILENSEGRLNKISGRTVESQPTDTSWNNSNIFEPGSPLSNFINSPSNISDSLDQSDIELDREDNEIEYTESFQQIPKRPAENHFYDNTYSENLNNTVDSNFGTEYSPGYNPEYNEKCKESLLHYYLVTSRICYILLAAIINILLLNDMGHVFGKAIAIPCFTLMLCRSYASGSFKNTTNGSLVFAALILCNIKPHIILQLRVMVNLLDMFLKDFALYIFSYVLIHYGISFMYKLDTLMSA